MNERIYELFEQTLKEFKQEHKYATYIVPDPIKEKFAQLMVFECVNAVMDGTKEGDHYAQRIEQHFDNGLGGILHFGVEE